MIIDSNILIDLFESSSGSAALYSRLAVRYGAIVNPVIFAEISPRFTSAGQVEEALAALNIALEDIDMRCAYRAGVAFRDYRRKGGPRESILPDFLIGAHAATAGHAILTRDRRRFESYFPEVELIDPSKVLQ